MFQRAIATRKSLIAVNLVLLAAVVFISLPAGAQNAGQPAGRARGEYTMVAGRSNSGGSHLVYVIDSANQELVALKWDQSKQTMTGVGYRNFNADTVSTPGR